ncbi:MAG: hypothetical protein QXD32_03160, partial [Nitrososphaerota archaeon]
MMSHWRMVDERLIRMGILILELKFVRSYGDEFMEMNDGKRGRPYMILYSYTLFLAVFRYVFSVGFRQLEGFTISLRKTFPIL